MTTVLAIGVGALIATGTYLLLRRSMLAVLFGVVLLGHGANLLIFALGGGVRGGAPIVPAGESVPAAPVADPLAQALVLTAIVIGFAVVAFLSMLMLRAAGVAGTLDSDALAAPSHTSSHASSEAES